MKYSPLPVHHRPPLPADLALKPARYGATEPHSTPTTTADDDNCAATEASSFLSLLELISQRTKLTIRPPNADSRLCLCLAEELARYHIIIQQIDREIEVGILHFSDRCGRRSGPHLLQRPRKPSACSEEASRPPQSTIMDDYEWVPATDIHARSVLMAELIHQGFGWIPTVVVPPPVIPLKNTWVSRFVAREKKRLSHSIPPYVSFSTYSQLTLWPRLRSRICGMVSVSQVLSGLLPQSSIYGYDTRHLTLVFVGKVKRREDDESSRTRTLRVLGRVLGLLRG